jgi:hypothetical protein
MKYNTYYHNVALGMTRDCPELEENRVQAALSIIICTLHNLPRSGCSVMIARCTVKVAFQRK